MSKQTGPYPKLSPVTYDKRKEPPTNREIYNEVKQDLIAEAQS